MLERRHHAGGGERAALGWDIGERVKADGAFGIGDIEIAHFVDPAPRD
jgi:hypothetical protein